MCIRDRCMSEPHDPYSGPKEYWDLYEDAQIDMPTVPFIPREARDQHSKRVYDCMDAGDYDITPERIVKARRAYYSMLSYIDSKVGELMKTLEEQGLADDTLIVFTSDHGDMQGERGMWFKETFHERATRVPLCFSGTPTMCERYRLQLEGRTVEDNVSLMDLFPTLAALTVTPSTLDWGGHPVDGRSLLPYLVGEDCSAVSTVLCEYTSEMVPGGWFMIKRGSLKLVYSSMDPLLYDLQEDPLENTNLAQDPRYADQLAGLLEVARETWPDLRGMNDRILASQRARRLVHASLMVGQRCSWDHEPRTDPSKYIRNTGERLQDQEYVCRAPYRGERPAR
eukprot:TRINITY_DN8535_c0_g1_i2.p1 TRINITY_DN8535_c0_g1~~TRINITY_DN8535_c0_g1_i2.p1  ORF type:complete len:373 (-),score=24.08 TRINITY_DN8535_c0_g1_i2:158-1174(-)